MTDRQLGVLSERLLTLTARWDPFLYSAVGISEADALVPSFGEADTAALRDEFTVVALQLGSIATNDLSIQDSLTLRMANWQADLWPRIIDSHREEFTLSPYKAWCLPTAVWSVLPKLRVDDEAGEVAVMERLTQLPAALAGAADALTRGTANGRTVVRRLASGSIRMLDHLLDRGDDLAGTISPIAGPGADADWAGRFRNYVDASLRPALAGFRRRLVDDIVPAARDDDRPGVCWIPGGDESYPASAAEHTTTNLTPEQLHRLGSESVAELADRVLPVAGRLFGGTDIPSLVRTLRGDPALRFQEPAEILTAAGAAFDRGLAALDGFVGTPPITECEIRQMPVLEATRMMQAYYRPGDHRSGRPGTFWLNTDLSRAPARYELPTLVAHESVPGHHVQWSRAREVDLPRYRTMTPTTAFIEGWAMYCESNGQELGLVTDDLSTIGVWSSLSWRACRLVVDTGLHALGWTRARAIDYLMANTATSLSNAEGEIDRYIGNPGQALAYYVGLLCLQQTRASAERRLGTRFDLRSFNDCILSLGSPPLAVAEAAVDDWMLAVSDDTSNATEGAQN